MSKKLLLVCNSVCPKQSDSACCSDRGSGALIEAFRTKIREAGLEDSIEVKSAPCMNNCANGISVRYTPDQTLYSKVSPEDLDEIIFSHLQHGRPVGHLQLARANRFLGF